MNCRGPGGEKESTDDKINPEKMIYDQKIKNYSAAFRAQVALAAARGDKTINEVASQFEIPPQMAFKMKARLKDRIDDIFRDERSRKKKPEDEITQEELFEQIGRLKIEVDWLKKICPVLMMRSVE